MTGNYIDMFNEKYAASVIGDISLLLRGYELLDRGLHIAYIGSKESTFNELSDYVKQAGNFKRVISCTLQCLNDGGLEDAVRKTGINLRLEGDGILFLAKGFSELGTLDAHLLNQVMSNLVFGRTCGGAGRAVDTPLHMNGKGILLVHVNNEHIHYNLAIKNAKLAHFKDRVIEVY